MGLYSVVFKYQVLVQYLATPKYLIRVVKNIVLVGKMAASESWVRGNKTT